MLFCNVSFCLFVVVVVFVVVTVVFVVVTVVVSK